MCLHTFLTANKATHSKVMDGQFHSWCKKGKLNNIEEFVSTCKDLPLRLAHSRGVLGYTPIHEAANNGHSAVLKLLIQYGAKVNCRTSSGSTPLHLAASIVVMWTVYEC